MASSKDRDQSHTASTPGMDSSECMDTAQAQSHRSPNPRRRTANTPLCAPRRQQTPRNTNFAQSPPPLASPASSMVEKVTK
eukprot:4991784-Pleurochrysis_carterae.AAC.1